MVGRGQGMGPCPNLIEAWVGERYSETWAQEVQLGCPEVLATLLTGGLPGHRGKEPPYHPTPSPVPGQSAMSFMTDWGY